MVTQRFFALTDDSTALLQYSEMIRLAVYRGLTSAAVNSDAG